MWSSKDSMVSIVLRRGEIETREGDMKLALWRQRQRLNSRYPQQWYTYAGEQKEQEQILCLVSGKNEKLV